MAGFMDLLNVRIEDAIIPFYLMSGILIVMGVIYYYSPLPEVRASGEEDSKADSLATDNSGSRTSIFQFPHLLLGIVAIFFDIGLETIALGTINDYASILAFPSPGQYVWFTSACMVLGYLLGIAFIPKVLDQSTALILSALLGIAVTVAIVLLPTDFSIYLVALLGLANALMWPAIWPLAIADLGNFTKMGSSLLVMGIIGGAILPLLFGYIADVASHQLAYWICLPSYLFILYYGTMGSKIRIR